ncbi:MAG: hypothetical protein ACI9SC_003292 [Gammaproteobacteria bacterium]|jgi:hypothetical protein
MRLPFSLLISLFLISSFTQVNAAREWKNPDQSEPLNRITSPAPIPDLAPSPVPQTSPMVKAPESIQNLEGQLRLKLIRVCNYQLSYVDKGSGGKIDGSFFLPNIPSGFAMIGAYAQGNYHEPSDCILAVQATDQQSTSLLQLPKRWERIWTDKGSGANMDGSIWHPIAASDDYVCLGSIAHKGYEQPAVTNYACLHHCLIENLPVGNPIWSTRGTGAKHDAEIYKLHNSNSFVIIPGNIRPTGLQDLKGDASCSF